MIHWVEFWKLLNGGSVWSTTVKYVNEISSNKGKDYCWFAVMDVYSGWIWAAYTSLKAADWLSVVQNKNAHICRIKSK